MPSVAPSRVKRPMTPQDRKEINDLLSVVIQAIKPRNTTC